MSMVDDPDARNGDNQEQSVRGAVSGRLSHKPSGLPESMSRITRSPSLDSVLCIPALVGADHGQYMRPPIPDAPHLDLRAEVRRLLAPVIARNTQARVEDEGTAKGGAPPGDVQNRIQGLLTDEMCDMLIKHMHNVERQKTSLPMSSENGIFGNVDKVPKAPRAMITSERVRLLEGFIRHHDDKKRPPAVNEQRRLMQTHSLVTISPGSSLNQSLPYVPLTTPSTEGITIPLDPQFLTHHTKGTEPEEGEIISSRENRASSFPSPLQVDTDSLGPRESLEMAAGDRKRRQSPIPEPLPHRLPPSRTYRRSQSPTGLPRRPPSPRYRHSRSSRSPDSTRHSHTTNYTKRLSSPRRRSTSRSPRSSESRHRYDRKPPSPATQSRPSEQKSPSPPRSRAAQPRRNSEFDSNSPTYQNEPSSRTLASLRGGRSCHDLDNKLNASHKAHHHHAQDKHVTVGGANGDTVSSDHHKSNHDRRRRSLSPSNGRKGHYMPQHRASVAVNATKPCHNVPGLWMAKRGLANIEILTCEFEIDQEAADRWSVRGSSRQVNMCHLHSCIDLVDRYGKEKEALSLLLVSLPVTAVEAKIDISTATAQDAANAIRRIDISWPPKGQLIAEVNPGRDWGQRWLPRHLGETRPPIDITEHVHQGMNVVRFIQLAGLTDYMFFVLAKQKPPEIQDADHAAVDFMPVTQVRPDVGTEIHKLQAGDILKSFVSTIKIIQS
ncbi:hypothetical protein AX17_006408 [Amanita inopinata Kibby_2008]|nr:hypothetical protein AX17_006408 [Amanita inopinata Kibby_2008]